MNDTFTYRGKDFTPAEAIQISHRVKKAIDRITFLLRLFTATLLNAVVTLTFVIMTDALSQINEDNVGRAFLALLVIDLGSAAWFFVSKWFITEDKVWLVGYMREHHANFVRAIGRELSYQSMHHYGFTATRESWDFIVHQGGGQFDAIRGTDANTDMGQVMVRLDGNQIHMTHRAPGRNAWSEPSL